MPTSTEIIASILGGKFRYPFDGLNRFAAASLIVLPKPAAVSYL
jgi:hypothetical protein